MVNDHSTIDIVHCLAVVMKEFEDIGNFLQKWMHKLVITKKGGGKKRKKRNNCIS